MNIMDNFTNNLLLQASSTDPEVVADLYKELSSGGGNPPNEDQITWFMENVDKFVLVGGHVGQVVELNTSSHGLYEGGRYPIYVKIVSSERFPLAIGNTYEYDITGLEIIKEEDMKRHSFAEVEVLMIERAIGKRFKDLCWKRFTEAVKEFGGSVRVTGGNFLTHEVVGLDEEDFSFILEYIK